MKDTLSLYRFKTGAHKIILICRDSLYKKNVFLQNLIAVVRSHANGNQKEAIWGCSVIDETVEFGSRMVPFLPHTIHLTKAHYSLKSAKNILRSSKKGGSFHGMATQKIVGSVFYKTTLRLAFLL